MRNRGSMGKKWVCHQGADGFQLIPIEEYNSSPLGSSHSVHQDTMEPTVHPMDGKVYDSKSQFRRTTFVYGCREVGNDYKTKDGIRPLSRASQRESVKESVLKVMQGYRGERH